MEKYCKKCGSKISPQEKYCLKCGNNLNSNNIGQKVNGTAKAGFIISIISIITCGATSFISLILSLVGLLTCDKNDKKGRSYSITGLIISVILIFIFVILIISVPSDNNSSSSPSTPQKTTQEENVKSPKTSENKKEEIKEYLAVDIDELEDALENNAAAAKDTYNGKYLEITGRLGTIDSDLKYISLLSTTDDWDMVGIHCSIKNSSTKDIVKSLSKDQTIIVKGKITDVGEVLGYYLDIDEIIPQ